MIIDLTSELTGTPDCEQPALTALTALTETPNLSNLLSNIHSILLLIVIGSRVQVISSPGILSSAHCQSQNLNHSEEDGDNVLYGHPLLSFS